MPMPPLLPVIDWRTIFDGGLEFGRWLETGEHPEHRAEMLKDVADLSLSPQQAGFLKAISRQVHVVAIAEDWCGDVVRHVPVLQSISDLAPNLAVRYITRQNHLDIFARFLSNGGEAIPKFIFLNNQFVECGNWGPMPGPCRELIARGKACGDVAAARKKVSALYEADGDRQMVITELLQLVDIAAAHKP